jgi:hypothetical protein
MSRHGVKLTFDHSGKAACPATGEQYVLKNGKVRVL